MRKIKIGILGCANIAKRMIIPNLLKTGKFEIVAFGSRAIDKATEYSNLFGGMPVEGYDKLLEIKEIEAIYIPLPTGMHYEWIMKCLNKYKHVFSEKSIATNYKEVSNIIEIAKKNNLCVFENFMFPFHSQIEFIKNKINNNEVGEIRLLKSSFGFPIFNKDNNIRYKKQLGGGSLLDAGAYTLLASQVFLGQKQKVISSCLNNLENDVDFLGSISLLNENNIVSQLSFGFDNFYQNNIEIWGSKGKIIANRAFTAGPGHMPNVVIEKHGEINSYQLPTDNHFIKILNEFYFSIIQSNYSYQFNQILSQAKLLSEAREKNTLIS
jgi:predicted dehydrogenase